MHLFFAFPDPAPVWLRQIMQLANLFLVVIVPNVKLEMNTRHKVRYIQITSFVIAVPGSEKAGSGGWGVLSNGSVVMGPRDRGDPELGCHCM